MYWLNFSEEEAEALERQVVDLGQGFRITGLASQHNCICPTVPSWHLPHTASSNSPKNDWEADLSLGQNYPTVTEIKILGNKHFIPGGLS